MEGEGTGGSSGASKSEEHGILSVSFNQDGSCFACGTNSGFRIFTVSPFQETVWRSFQRGGISIVEMMYRSNLIAVVGGGQTPRYPRNKVFIWDDHQGRNVGELAFEHHVKAVRMRRDKIVVVLKFKTYVYRFNDLKLMDQITTLANNRGLVSLCSDPNHSVLALPGLTKGSIRVELYDLRKAYLINAHETDLSCFALNNVGSRICSASEKGTLIRIWDCYTGDQLRELRRGADRADIYCLTFNWNSAFLACSSDKGTIHIFSLTDTAGESGDADDEALNLPRTQANGTVFNSVQSASPTGDGRAAGLSSKSTGGNETTNISSVGAPTVSSSLSPTQAPTLFTDDDQAPHSEGDASNIRSGLAFMRGMLPGLVPKYFGSEWSYAKIKGLEGRCICAFDPDSDKYLLNVVSADGTFSDYSFKDIKDAGECKRLTSKRFVANP